MVTCNPWVGGKRTVHFKNSAILKRNGKFDDKKKKKWKVLRKKGKFYMFVIC